MDLYAEFIRYVIHPAVMVKRGNIDVLKYLKEFEASQYLSVSTIRTRQWDRLRKLISHAYESSDFYRIRFSEAGLSPSNIKDFSDYSKVPLLSKRDIQDHLLDLRSKRYRPEELVPNKTGGSTGMPLHYYHDKRRMLSMEASAIRHFRWAGRDIGDKIGVIWGNRRDLSQPEGIKSKLRGLFLERTLTLDTSSITEEALDRFARELLRFKPKSILAYAKSIYFFCAVLQGKRHRGHSSPVNRYLGRSVART